MRAARGNLQPAFMRVLPRAGLLEVGVHIAAVHPSLWVCSALWCLDACGLLVVVGACENQGSGEEKSAVRLIAGGGSQVAPRESPAARRRLPLVGTCCKGWGN